ncbi:MAG: hypothetical protein GXY82_09700 [Methanospirillum sp.]|nr:hypothetical protein [Methanospirillum sp.]
MKQVIQADGAELGLDTDRDTLLYSAPRPDDDESAARRRGTDMYLHTDEGGQEVFYAHRWSLVTGEKEALAVLPARQAERFLGERGLDCPAIPGAKAFSTLREWGYGIIEEF